MDLEAPLEQKQDSFFQTGEEHKQVSAVQTGELLATESLMDPQRHVTAEQECASLI